MNKECCICNQSNSNKINHIDCLSEDAMIAYQSTYNVIWNSVIAEINARNDNNDDIVAEILNVRILAMNNVYDIIYAAAEKFVAYKYVLNSKP